MTDRSYELYTKLKILCPDDSEELLELIHDVIRAGITLADLRRVFSLLLIVKASKGGNAIVLDSEALSKALEVVRRRP